MTEPLNTSSLEFCQDFKIFLDTSFFSELRDYKINYQKLNSDIIDLPSSNINIFRKTITLSKNSFDSEKIIPGSLLNFNTIEEFKQLDKVKYIKECALNERTRFNFFNVISFADLKKYNLVYWINIPVLKIKGLEFDIYFTDESGINVPEEYYISNFVYTIHNSVFINSSLMEHTKGKVVVPNLIKTYLIHQILIQSACAEYSLYFVDKKSVIKCGKVSAKYNNNKIDVPPFCYEDVAVSGWEKNNENRLIPKFINFSKLLDPIELNKQNVNLNLQLMKWRIKPDLKLEKIASQKVLILGAGTLGCYVSRCLLGWGIYDITFVDHGTVSNSNPVRQSLFGYDDVGKPKAKTASESLKKIYPLCNSQYVDLKIPMVGHIDTIDKTTFTILQREIKKSDVVFILMDSREARWLPTLISKAENKIVINAAIGFDSYVVMKHGNLDNDTRHGCYYCSDIVAPLDSLSNKTLDQMCTVTRPGCAMLASSTAVELLISYIQEGNLSYNQVRSNLNQFTSVTNVIESYKHCSACSNSVVDAYKTEGWSFVSKALSDPKFLEDVCGLTQEHLEAQKILENMEDMFI